MKKQILLILVLLVTLVLTHCKALYGPAGEGQKNPNTGINPKLQLTNLIVTTMAQTQTQVITPAFNPNASVYSVNIGMELNFEILVTLNDSTSFIETYSSNMGTIAYNPFSSTEHFFYVSELNTTGIFAVNFTVKAMDNTAQIYTIIVTREVVALAPNTPSLSPNLALWLDATDSVYTDSGCTNLPSGGADMIRCWKDKSQYNKNATVSAGSYPYYSPTGLNGYPAVQFYSGSQLYNNLMSINYTGIGITVITVSFATPASGLEYLFELSDGTNFLYQFVGNSSDKYGAGSTVGYQGGSGWNNGIPVIFSTVFIFNGGSPFNYIRQYHNNSSMFEIQTTVPANSYMNTRYSIGCNFSTGYSSNNSIIAEIIVFDRELTTIERQGVEKYLSNKYGIPLTQ